MDKRITLTDAGAIGKCSHRTIARAISAGELVADKQHGRILIERAALDRWIAVRQARSRRRVPPSHVERAIAAELQAVTEAL